MRALLRMLAMVGVMGAIAPASLQAQATPSQLIESFRPMQKDLPVDYDTPTDKAEIEACKVETSVNREAGTFAYLLRDRQGRILRQFADTNGKKDSKGQTRLDRWSYYKDGFEVYREVDLDEDGVLDECRWMNAAGTRVAQIRNNRIVGWSRLSAEEASKIMVVALAARNLPLLETLMASDEELTALKLPKTELERLTQGRAQRAEQVTVLAKALTGWNEQVAWSRFDGTLPHLIPADAGLSDDLVLYENAFIFVNMPGDQADPLALAYLQAPEIVKLSETWKFVDLPHAVDPSQPATTVVEGGIRAALYQMGGGEGSDAGTNPELEKSLTALADLDRNAPPIDGTNQELARFHVERVNLLFQVIKNSTDAQEQLNFTKQAVDSLAAAFQTGLYPAAADRLDQYAGQSGPIASYAAYRKILAEYALDANQPGSDYIKAQKDYLEKLAVFLEEHPKGDEVPDVLFQLASINEFNAEEEEAVKYYEQLVRDLPDTEPGQKAAGALRRLKLVGQELSLEATGIKGQPVSSSQFKGKTLLVLFWTTAADSVRRDIPELLRVYQKFEPKGFSVIGVCLDPDRSSLDAFVADTPLPWSLIQEEGGMDGPLANQFGIISLPTMLLVDKDGKVLNRNIRTASELERYLENMNASADPERVSLDTPN